MMAKERKGEIAVAFMKQMLREKGLHLTPNLRREIGKEASAAGVNIDEAMEFVETIVREIVEEAFKK